MLPRHLAAVFVTAAFLFLLPEASAQQPESGIASSLQALEFRYVGPTRGGRVTAVAGTVAEPGTFYFGATGGGVWKTEDYGSTWTNVSDGYFDTPSIGAIRVAQNDPNIVYVGTGSDGLRSNVIAGRGVYKSIDGGETWNHIGLRDTGQIGALEIDPRDHNVVFVAAIGSAFGDNPERGVYRTRNGGMSWEKVLFLSDSTGFYDVDFMPSNPNIIYATAWRAERKPWTIISGGPENGIYRSVDGGDNWMRVGGGLPSLMGKIDLAVTPADSRLVYAIVEARGDSTGLYKSVDHGETFVHISDDRRLLERAFYYTNLYADPKDPQVVHSLATRYVKSVDGGKTWQSRSAPHGDHHDLWMNPDNPDLFIQSNDGGANVTFNGGETWSSQLNQPTAEIYQVEVDEQYPYWVYGGQQDNYTAVSVPSLAHSHQAGAPGLITNVGGCETGPAVPRPDNSDIVYANCKGNFTVYNKHTKQEQRYSVGGQYMYGHNPADLILRFQRVSPIHISPHDPDRLYHASQYVHLTTDGGKNWETISPDLTAFEADKQVISGSPITRDITGEEFYSTIYSIRESSVQPGVIWVGANDGPVHVTRDGGENWIDVTPRDLPPGARIDSVEPSPHDSSVAYIAALRYQLGDPRPYIFKTSDFGRSWTQIVNGLPGDAPTRVVREDPDRAGLLYAGTEWGLFVSFDDGANWHSFQQNLPVTPVTDIKVHRDDLVLSTMGRGFWILDDLSSLQQGAESIVARGDETADTGATLFAPRNTYRYRMSGAGVYFDYVLPALPEDAEQTVTLSILDNDDVAVVTLTNKRPALDKGAARERDMATNQVPYSVSRGLTADEGLNRFVWNMRTTGPWHQQEARRWGGGPTAAPGTYIAELTVEWDISDGRRSSTVRQPFNLIMDPRVANAGVTARDVDAQIGLAHEVIDLLSQARKLAAEVENKLQSSSELSADELESYEVLRDALIRPSGRYTQPMLVSQIEYLYGMLDRADQRPGQDMFDRLEVLRREFASLVEANPVGSETEPSQE